MVTEIIQRFCTNPDNEAAFCSEGRMDRAIEAMALTIEDHGEEDAIILADTDGVDDGDDDILIARALEEAVGVGFSKLRERPSCPCGNACKTFNGGDGFCSPRGNCWRSKPRSCEKFNCATKEMWSLAKSIYCLKKRQSSALVEEGSAEGGAPWGIIVLASAVVLVAVLVAAYRCRAKRALEHDLDQIEVVES